MLPDARVLVGWVECSDTHQSLATEAMGIAALLPPTVCDRTSKQRRDLRDFQGPEKHRAVDEA